MKLHLLLFGFLSLVAATVFSGSTLAQDRPMGQPEQLTNSKSVQIFPNPAVEYVHIKTENAKAEDIKLTVHNIIGNAVETETEIVSEHELRVKVKDLAAGYYLIALRDETSNFKGTYKFLKR